MNFLPDPTRSHAEHIPYALDDTRRQALWLRLRDGQDLGSSPWSTQLRVWLGERPMVVPAVALAAIALAVAIQARPSAPASAWSGARLQAGDEPVQVALADGSRIQAGPHGAIELLSGSSREVRLAVRKGTGRFSVAKNPDRDFIVAAGPVQVRVVGTRFAVQRDDAQGQVSVEVDEGIVEVTSGTDRWQLRAGQSLQVPLIASGLATGDAPLPRVRPRNPGPPDSSKRQAHVGSEVAEAPTTANSPGSARSIDSTAANARPVKGATTSIQATPGAKLAAPGAKLAAPGAELAATVNAPARPRTARRLRRVDAAKNLLNAAQDAQQTGDRRSAAAKYATLIRRHPQDGRAPLAAFELGRLRMDHLGDPKGAMKALSWSLRKAPSSPFRQDAMARMVRAASQRGGRACVPHRKAYLRQYPQGRHRADVLKQCPVGLQ